jgi:hypothetical protein
MITITEVPNTKFRIFKQAARMILKNMFRVCSRLSRLGRGEFFCRLDAESLVSRLRKRQLSLNLLPVCKNFLCLTKQHSCFCLARRQAPFAIYNHWSDHLVGKKIPLAPADKYVTFYRYVILRTTIKVPKKEIDIVARYGYSA